jgi:NADH dehydrogenase (ubiquinone) 1 beta subcomplex subunit 3
MVKTIPGKFASTVTRDRVGTLTGFNPSHLLKAGMDHARKFNNDPLNVANKDPWIRNEAWRYMGQFSRFNRLVKGTFPGLGIASVAFAGYLVYDAMTGDEHHGEEHH